MVLVGASDDGSVANIEVTDKLLQTLSDMKTDGKTVLPPTLTVERRILEGVLAIVTVWSADAPPVRHEGRIWIRVGPRRGPASTQDERTLNEKRRYRDRTFDAHPVTGRGLGELNRVVFENEHLPQAVAADVLRSNDRSYQERLASMRRIASVSDPTRIPAHSWDHLGKSDRRRAGTRRHTPER